MRIHDLLNFKARRDLDINKKKCRVSINRNNTKKIEDNHSATDL